MAEISSEEESVQSDEKEKTEEQVSDAQGHEFYIEEAIDEELPESQDNHFDEEMMTLLSQDSLGTLHDQGMVPPFVGFSSISGINRTLGVPNVHEDMQFIDRVLEHTADITIPILDHQNFPTGLANSRGSTATKDVLITIEESRLVSTNTNTNTNTKDSHPELSRIPRAS